jgi:anti-sigma regulatory factor (Ser/Thr protein kinase)
MAVRCDQSASSLVRRAIEDARELLPVLDDARLVASELVNNAVLHSGCGPDAIISISARLDGDYVTISVRDPGGSGHAPKLLTRDDRLAGGLGLRIVQQVAHRWGTGSGQRPGSANENSVWAELALGQT